MFRKLPDQKKINQNNNNNSNNNYNSYQNDNNEYVYIDNVNQVLDFRKLSLETNSTSNGVRINNSMNNQYQNMKYNGDSSVNYGSYSSYSMQMSYPNGYENNTINGYDITDSYNNGGYSANGYSTSYGNGNGYNNANGAIVNENKENTISEWILYNNRQEYYNRVDNSQNFNEYQNNDAKYYNYSNYSSSNSYMKNNFQQIPNSGIQYSGIVSERHSLPYYETLPIPIYTSNAMENNEDSLGDQPILYDDNNSSIQEKYTLTSKPETSYSMSNSILASNNTYLYNKNNNSPAYYQQNETMKPLTIITNNDNEEDGSYESYSARSASKPLLNSYTNTSNYLSNSYTNNPYSGGPEHNKKRVSISSRSSNSQNYPMVVTTSLQSNLNSRHPYSQVIDNSTQSPMTKPRYNYDYQYQRSVPSTSYYDGTATDSNEDLEGENNNDNENENENENNINNDNIENENENENEIENENENENNRDKDDNDSFENEKINKDFQNKNSKSPGILDQESQDQIKYEEGEESGNEKLSSSNENNTNYRNNNAIKSYYGNNTISNDNSYDNDHDNDNNNDNDNDNDNGNDNDNENENDNDSDNTERERNYDRIRNEDSLKTISKNSSSSSPNMINKKAERFSKQNSYKRSSFFSQVVESNNFKCPWPDCDQSFASVTLLNAHEIYSHGTPYPPYPLPQPTYAELADARHRLLWHIKNNISTNPLNIYNSNYCSSVQSPSSSVFSSDSPFGHNSSKTPTSATSNKSSTSSGTYTDPRDKKLVEKDRKLQTGRSRSSSRRGRHDEEKEISGSFDDEKDDLEKQNENRIINKISKMKTDIPHLHIDNLNPANPIKVSPNDRLDSSKYTHSVTSSASTTTTQSLRVQIKVDIKEHLFHYLFTPYIRYSHYTKSYSCFFEGVQGRSIVGEILEDPDWDIRCEDEFSVSYIKMAGGSREAGILFSWERKKVDEWFPPSEDENDRPTLYNDIVTINFVVASTKKR